MRTFIFKNKIIKLFVFLFSFLFLFSCNQFSTEKDRARALYAYDSSLNNNIILNGTTQYGILSDEEQKKKKQNPEIKIKQIYKNFYKWQDCHSSKLLKELKEKAKEHQIVIPHDQYWFDLDEHILQKSLQKCSFQLLDSDQKNQEGYRKCLREFGYIKYINNLQEIDEWNSSLKNKDEGYAMGTDFRKLYEELVLKKIENISSYISFQENFLYGNFGYDNNPIYLEPKSWGNIKNSSFDFIFVYPITYLIEKLVILFGNNSLAKLVTIFLIIFVIKLIMMLLFSIKSDINKQKIFFLQDELEKAKEKFLSFDSKTQRILFSQEQRKIYQKNNIKMFFIFTDTIAQILFFIFIPNIIKASAILSTGNVFNLFLNKSIKDTIFQKPGVQNGWLSALIFFIIIILVQMLSFSISIFFQNKYKKNNSIMVNGDKTKKFMPYIFFALIVIMGFFFPFSVSICTSLINVLFNIIQTIIVQLIISHKIKKGLIKL